MSKLSVNEAIAKARTYAEKGNMAQAQSLYLAILKRFPKNQEAINGLSSLKRPGHTLDKKHPSRGDMERLENLYRSGQMADALQMSREMLKRFPEAYLVLNIQGAAAAQIGEIDAAIKAFQNIILFRPTYSAAHFNLGNLFKEKGELAKAEGAYRAALTHNPNYPEAQYNLGIVYQAQGQFDQAVSAYKKAIALNPNYAQAYNNLGNVLTTSDQGDAALAAYQKALKLNPNFGDAYNNIAKLLSDLGNTEDSISMYKKAIKFNPASPEILYNLGNTLRSVGRSKEALDAFEKAVALKPGYAEAHNNAGLLHKDEGRHEQAKDAFQTALSLNPALEEAQFNLGNLLQEQGNTEAAIAAFEALVETYPKAASVHRALSALRTYHDQHPHLSKVEAILSDDGVSQEDRCQLHYAYAKMKEDIGALEEAFDNYIIGAKIRKDLLGYDLAEDHKLFEKIKLYTAKIMDQCFHPEKRSKMPRPIFILGMPRSGTTLVEQILSCHSDVQGGGELPFLRQHSDGLHFGRHIISAEKLKGLRISYLKDLAQRSDSKGYVTDKLPHNFTRIALIRAALPEAKIIHLCRDPRATCWSNFKHYFPDKGLGYSYDLMDVVNYYELYRDMMEFWDQNYGGSLYHLDYEALTIHQEEETRNLLAYLDLAWDDACLSPHKNTRSIRTASQQQVRQKVYQGASREWKKFEPFLKGVFDRWSELEG